MIKMDRYKSEFEEKYWRIVESKVSEDNQRLILTSCKKYLPEDFFESKDNPTFREIILSPFANIKKAEHYIKSKSMSVMKAECFDPGCKNEADINNLYIQIYKAFEKVMDAQRHKFTTRVQIVRESGFTVCPYCNRDYINSRADNVSGAQLDHFYSKSAYPLFAVSLYNLVPVCGNCNRIKSDKVDEFASPFDDTIDWNKDIKFGYHSKSLDHIEIDIISQNPSILKNIAEMRIKEAYQIHELEILELQSKQQAYSESQTEEIQDVLHKLDISDDDIKHIIFGSEIMPADMRKKPLGKMLSDLHKEMKIY